MFNKFKSALYNVVGNFDSGDDSLGSGIPSPLQAAGGSMVKGQTKEKCVRFPYKRPHFLQLNSDEEVLVTADHVIRPIICPRDINKLPWYSGYAETINAGKSKKNEDQAKIHVGHLIKTHKRHNFDPLSGAMINGVKDSEDIAEQAILLSPQRLSELSTDNSSSDIQVTQNVSMEHLSIALPYFYFGIFDGHAGWGAAVSAANQLHQIIHDRLSEVVDLLIPDSNGSQERISSSFLSPERQITPDSVVIGALEQAFWQMDNLIGADRQKFQLTGGCTACIGLFILGKLYVSNAGDSRALVVHEKRPIPMSFDFTPETESARIRKLGGLHPELLDGEYTHLDFLQKPTKKFLGQKVIYRDHYMTGWAYKTLTHDDFKYPLICGEGKRSRVLATIGVTRGFGDHDLRAQLSSVPIKPFLSPEPEVRIFDVADSTLCDSDVLILATDGLWDITSNEAAAEIVVNSLEQYPAEDTHRYKYKYTGAAQDLVMNSRGKLKDSSWRTNENKHATIDDISVFVIPLLTYKLEHQEWQQKLLSFQAEVARVENMTSLVNGMRLDSVEEAVALTADSPIVSN